MNCILYMPNDAKVSVFEQHNICNEKAKRYGYSVEHRIFDIRGDRFTEAINKAIASMTMEGYQLLTKANADFDAWVDSIIQAKLYDLKHKN